MLPLADCAAPVGPHVMLPSSLAWSHPLRYCTDAFLESSHRPYGITPQGRHSSMVYGHGDDFDSCFHTGDAFWINYFRLKDFSTDTSHYRLGTICGYGINRSKRRTRDCLSDYTFVFQTVDNWVQVESCFIRCVTILVFPAHLPG